MLKRILANLLYGVCAIALLTSCGSTKASGTGEFATVYATASPGVTHLDSDIATFVDSTGASAPACSDTSSAMFSPDDVVYNINVTPFTPPNTGNTSTIAPSDLIITKITVTLTPANSVTPALPATFQTQFPTSGQLLKQGTSTAVTVRIMSDTLKMFLFNDLGLNCSNPSALFQYRATVSFEAQEVNTQRGSTITAPGFLLVSVANFPDASAK